jgi:hypothetical protein
MGAEVGALPAPPVRERTVLPVVAVVLALIVVVFGGYVTASALSPGAGGPVDVGGLVRVTPLPGWELAKRSSDPAGARLTRGSGTLDVFAGSFDGRAGDLIGEYVTGSLEAQAEQLSVSRIQALELASGLLASRVSYVGTFRDVQVPIEGEVTAVVSSSGVGAVFDGWAPSGQLGPALEDVRAMIDAAEVA